MMQRRRCSRYSAKAEGGADLLCCPLLAACFSCRAVLQSVQYNGSLYSHVVFARSGIDLDAPEDEVPPDSIFTTSTSASRRASSRGTTPCAGAAPGCCHTAM